MKNWNEISETEWTIYFGSMGIEVEKKDTWLHTFTCEKLGFIGETIRNPDTVDAMCIALQLCEKRLCNLVNDLPKLVKTTRITESVVFGSRGK